jgi:hypothetical protein
MSTFKEANQVRLALKMKLSQYSWYISSVVIIDDDGYGVLVLVKHVDNNVRKTISPVIDGVGIKTESKYK